MAIVLKRENQVIKIDSNQIVGVIGNNYQEFLSLLSGKDIYIINLVNRFQTNSVIDEIKNNYHGNQNLSSIIPFLLKELSLPQSFIDKKINELSHSEKRLLKYLIMLVTNRKIIVIDEPFIDLDSYNKKIIVTLFQKIVRMSKKTIIIGSSNINNIYTYCKKVLILYEDKSFYGDVKKLLTNKKYLDQFHLDIPDLVKFVLLARQKKINIRFSVDIRDLIKDVYRNAS